MDEMCISLDYYSTLLSEMKEAIEILGDASEKISFPVKDMQNGTIYGINQLAKESLLDKIKEIQEDVELLKVDLDEYKEK